MNHSITYQRLVSLKNGDASSFRLIYDEYHSLIYYYSLKFLRQEQIAEEATADVFILLWQKRTIIDPSLPIQALLYKIAKDTAYNYLKKIASNSRLKRQFVKNYPTIEFKDGEVTLLEKEQLSQVETIIESLPPKRQAVFKLRYYEGFDNGMIAEQLGISINTVKVHLSKARLYLKEELLHHKGVYTCLGWIFVDAWYNS